MKGVEPPYGAAAVAALLVFVLYAATMAPTTAFWDTSEYIATAHILGVPHPPGNPLFVVVARAWSVLLSPTGLPVAVRINLFAAATSAAASGFLFLVAHRLIAPILEGRRQALVGAAAATLVGATTFTVWNQSNVNEKVYTLSVLVMSAVTWLVLRWRDRQDDPGNERILLAALFLLALGSTNHLMSVLPLPAIAVLVLLTRPSVLLGPRFLGRALLLVVLGLSFNFVLPIRAAQDPVINEGDATCETFLGAAQAIYTNGRAGCPMLAANLTRAQYQKPPLTQRMAPFSAQVENYGQYFDWQWARGIDASEQLGTARLPVTLLFLGLGLAGLWVAWRADRVALAYLIVLVGTVTIALIYYLNFRYGYSLAPEVTDLELHEVRERDYFFLGSFLFWGMLSGVGLAWVWGSLAFISRSPRRWTVTAPVLSIAFIPMVLNWSWASRTGDHAARDWAFDLLMSVEPYGILFTNGDNDTFPLWYLQEVEGIRRDVTVVVGQYLFTSWYLKQLQELTSPDRQRPFDASQGAGLYAAPASPPSRPLTDMARETQDRVTGVELSEDFSIPFSLLSVTYPAGTVLDRVHQLALSIIHDSEGARPVYFASSAGLMRELGLGPWGVRHGLVTKLVIRDLSAEQPEGWITGAREYGGETFDLARSLALYKDVYGYRGLRERAIWADRSTLNIPFQYYVFALQLSDVARSGGTDPEVVQRLEADALAFQVVAGGGTRGTPQD